MLEIAIDDELSEDKASELEREYRSKPANIVRPLSSDAQLQRIRSGDTKVTKTTASIRKTESQQQFPEVNPKDLIDDSQEPSKITGG